MSTTTTGVPSALPAHLPRPQNPFARAPLLEAALAFALGILLASFIWRPATWWIFAAVSFLLAALYFLPRRTGCARILALAAVALCGALNLQLAGLGPLSIENDVRFAQLTNGEAALITARVVRDGLVGPGSWHTTSQHVDVETEELQDSSGAYPMRFGIRMNFYSSGNDASESEEETPAEILAVKQPLEYGQRIRFTAKLRPLRNFRTPGSFDYRGFLAQQNIVALGSAKAEDVELLPGFAGSRAALWLSRVRRSILATIATLWAPRDAALMAAMLIGDRTGVDYETTLDYQRTGAYHILVVAGLKVGILAYFLLWVMRSLRVPDWLNTAITILACALYALLSNAGTPVLRATAMLCIYLCARSLYRERSHWNAIGAAGLFLLAWNSRALFEASFQLTFISMIAIVGLAFPLMERTSLPYQRALRHFNSLDYDLALPPRLAQFRLDLRLISGRLAQFAGARIAAGLLLYGWRTALAAYDVLVLSAMLQLSLALPMAYYFHRAITMGLPANAIVVPLHGALLPLALLAVGINYASPMLARLPAWLAAALLHGTNYVVELLAHLRVSGLAVGDMRVATPSRLVTLFAVAAFLVALAGMRRKHAAFVVSSISALFTASLWITLPPPPDFKSGVLEITTLDVGQGDSLLVVTPQGRTLLIDAGGQLGGSSESQHFDTGEDIVSPYLWSRGITRLDAVALTHAHADHIGGIHSVLANFRPRELWLGPVPSTRAVLAMLQEAGKDGVAVIRRNTGDAFPFGGATVRVLAPPPAWRVQPERAQNNDSLVLKITYENTSALLEGDAEKQVERDLLKEQPEAQLLKVAHHGSASSSIPELLAAVHPQYAVVSAGFRNPYHHPRPEVLARLQAAGVLTYRTDTMGTTTFYLDGVKVTARLAAVP